MHQVSLIETFSSFIATYLCKNECTKSTYYHSLLNDFSISQKKLYSAEFIKKPTFKELVVIKNKTDTKLVFISGENGTDINDMRSFKMKAEAKMHGNSIFAGIAAGQQRRLSLEKYGSVHQIIEGYSAIHNKKTTL